jgi:hypothetical protein
VQRLDLAARLRRARAALGGDYSGASLNLLIFALLYAGARRLEHTPALSRRRPVHHAVLWLGAGADAPHREQLAQALTPLRLRHQGRVLELAASQAAGRGPPALEAPRAQRHGVMTDLSIPQWNLQLRVMLYRKHVQHGHAFFLSTRAYSRFTLASLCRS